MRYSEINEGVIEKLISRRFSAVHRDKKSTIEYMIKQARADNWLHVAFIINILRDKGHTWPELDAFEKSARFELAKDPTVKFPQRFSDFGSLDESRGESKIMYHGTSSKFLPQIMKFGLIPNPSERVYDKDDEGGWESYFGTYLTSSKDEAKDAAAKTVSKFQGDWVVIAVQVLMKSSDTDEDDIGQLFSSAINAASFSWAPDQLKKTGREMGREEKIKKIFEILYEHMEYNKIKLNQKAIQTLKDMEKFMSLPDNDELAIGSGLEEITYTYPEMRDMVDILAQNMVYKSPRPRRVLQPIKFKGKTRIVKIEQYVDVIENSAVGADPEDFKYIDDWIEVWPKNEVKRMVNSFR